MSTLCDFSYFLLLLLIIQDINSLSDESDKNLKHKNGDLETSLIRRYLQRYKRSKNEHTSAKETLNGESIFEQSLESLLIRHRRSPNEDLDGPSSCEEGNENCELSRKRPGPTRRTTRKPTTKRTRRPQPRPTPGKGSLRTCNGDNCVDSGEQQFSEEEGVHGGNWDTPDTWWGAPGLPPIPRRLLPPVPYYNAQTRKVHKGPKPAAVPTWWGAQYLPPSFLQPRSTPKPKGTKPKPKQHKAKQRSKDPDEYSDDY